jgi:hypothetical protein
MDPRTCREAVLEAMRRLEQRHGRLEFKLAEILQETMKFGRWEPTTIQTHVSAHMCNGRAGSELERAAPGVYRRRRDQGWRREPPHGESAPSLLVASTADVDAAKRRASVVSVVPQGGGAEAPAVTLQIEESGAAFQERARTLLSQRWGVDLAERAVTLVGGVVKKFDLVSPDAQIVGDAKSYKNLPSPSAKWSAIAEYVWLLQHTTARRRFLVFGNSDLVPSRWLLRFAPLCREVEFLFIDGDEIIDLKAELAPALR